MAIAVAAIGVSAASSCTKRGDLDGVAEALNTALSGAPPRGVTRDVWATTARFYAARTGAPAWVDAKKPTKRSAAAVASLEGARKHALDPADYDAAGLLAERTKLTDAKDPKDASDDDRRSALAAFDVRLTTAMLSLAHDVALGRTSPGALDARWKARRAPPNFAAALEGAIGGNLDAWLDAVRPVHPEYAQLQQALVELAGVQQRGGWPRVDTRGLGRGRSSAAVLPLRQRLAAAGFLDDAAGTSKSPAFDDAVDAGVKAFQEHHGLKATGVVDATTAGAMNVSVDQRIAQVGLNLERWRWMPDELGARHLIVNIPRYHVIARENGRPVLDIRVVVGKVGNETPVFSGDMQTVVFSPYWNIPDTILTGETAPSVMKDRNYLAKNNIEVLRVSSRGAERVDPDDVDWNDADALKQLSVRQKPGAQNALGHVKFLFPNPYDVYLHDTPADSLFSRQGRALSHGCVRVEEPETLANYVLRGYAEWPEEKILTAMNAGEEQHVKLKDVIPVHIVYFTTWVDDDGGMHFQQDVYGYDARQLQKQARKDL
jgi:murein L,D-transpeptidase YcbB/YkuD